MRPGSGLVLAAGLAVLLTGAPARAGQLKFVHLAGGGPRADDCLAGVEVVGVNAAPRARTVVCQDGDPA